MEIVQDEVTSELRMAEQEAQLEISKTTMRKAQFIATIKHGLGDSIKANPNKVRIIKKPLGERIKAYLLKIFTKF